MKMFIFFIASLWAQGAWAFPEMVRHGYVNCTACHTHPQGGGLLNEYGRALSAELLSSRQFFFEKKPEVKPESDAPSQEASFLAGSVDLPNWLNLGGHVRLLQTNAESRARKQGHFYIMQVEMEAEAKAAENLEFFATAGRIEPKGSAEDPKDYFLLRQYGVGAQLTDPKLNHTVYMRIGRFTPHFGLPIAEHPTVTRAFLGLTPGQERAAAEFHFLTETFDFSATVIAERYLREQARKETGQILTGSHAFASTFKVGASYYQSNLNGTGPCHNQNTLGVFGALGWSPRLFSLHEIDQGRCSEGTQTLLSFHKLGYELQPGLITFVTHEYANSDADHREPHFEVQGIGVQYFPRPHWDFLANFRREMNTAIDPSEDLVLWLLLHYYL